MRGGTRIDKVITHGCKYFEEKKKDVAGREKQEVRGGVMADLVEKVRHTADTGRTSIMTLRGIYDDEQGQGVFTTGFDTVGWEMDNSEGVP